MASVTTVRDLLSRAPIISNPAQADGADVITTYRDQFFSTNIPALAAKASATWSSYFSAYSGILHDAKSAPVFKVGLFRKLLQFIDPLHTNVPEADYSQPGILTDAFKYHAGTTSNVLLNHYVVGPQGIFRDTEGLRETVTFPNGDYVEGFIQSVHSKNSGDPARPDIVSSVSFAFLGLDERKMAAIAPYAPERMYEALQTTTESCSHDVHHFFTSLVSADEIIQRRRPESYTERMHAYEDAHYKDNVARHPQSYENMLIATHAEILGRLRTGPEDQRAAWDKLETSVETYLDELERISHEIRHDAALTDIEKHAVVDYFATLVPFNLAKVVPMNDPLMERALGRMEAIDPDPSFAAEDFTRSFKATSLAAAIEDMRTPDQPPERNKNDYTEDNPFPSWAMILDYYERGGNPLLPADSDALSYKTLKQLQAIKAIPQTAMMLIPNPPAGTHLAQARDQVGSLNRGVLNIIAADMVRKP